jgi:hypothetical protein
VLWKNPFAAISVYRDAIGLSSGFAGESLARADRERWRKTAPRNFRKRLETISVVVIMLENRPARVSPILLPSLMTPRQRHVKAVCGAVIICLGLLGLAKGAAAGIYQHATDGQTFVWNSYPDPDDSVSWSGRRDSQRYATGPGTLTWFKRGVFNSRYTGTMFRGRWNGIVTNEDADGKKYRGTFVDGKKSNDWRQIGEDAGAAGTYQKTYDGRAYVWNNYPKADDQVAWSGDIDADGYATGPGQVTWGKNGIPISYYAGMMERGKWNGLVTNVDEDGKKYQGTFVAGVKTSDWKQVTEFDLRPVLTPEQKALNDRWANYLKEIQANNAYQNWSAPPYDLYVSKQ